MIKEGSKVKFDYTLTVDGKTADTSAGRGPLEYVHGAGHIIPGLEEELTGMIKTGEIITIETAVPAPEQLQAIKELPHVFQVDYENGNLKIQCTEARHNLVRILHCLEENNISFGRVFSELPTLNDVFLHITGTQLRD